MKLKTILLAAVAAVAVWPVQAGAQGIAETVAERVASLASFENFGPQTYNPCCAEDACCEDGSCGSCSRCCRRMDLWGSAEFLLWWGKGSVTPPLVTTSPDGTPQLQAGVLPDAQVLFGREYLGNGLQPGGRVNFGIWLDEDHNVGAAGRFYATGGDVSEFSASSTGSPILARPFYNVVLDQNDALLIAFPGVATGSIDVRYSNQNFLGAESYLEIMMSRERCRRVDLIAGYQFMRLDDWLEIDSTHIASQLNNLQFDIRDRFSTQNEFHGGQIGVRAQMMRGCWSFDALAKVALGVTRQQVTIAGTTNLTPGPLLTGGLLAQDSNIGTFQRDKFGFIPEFTLNLKYHVNPCLSFHVGYSIIWWSDVVTSGRQIDTGVNLTQLTGPLIGEARPAFSFRDEYYWLQGINFGVNWDF